MTSQAFAPLDITPLWVHINDELIELVDVMPEDKLDWSPSPELWNTRGILLHIAIGRHGTMSAIIKDGKTAPDIIRGGQTPQGLKDQLRIGWERLQPLLTDPEALDREYDLPFGDKTGRLTGHWLAAGHVEHDIHHRADIYHYLALLGVKHGEPDTIMRMFGVGRA